MLSSTLNSIVVSPEALPIFKSVLYIVATSKVPLASISPVTVKLSLIVVSDVECPIDIGTPLVALLYLQIH